MDISKGTTRFGSHQFIVSYSKSVFGQLAEERGAWDRFSRPLELPEQLAYYLGEINALHPFREGNGRTQLIFIGQLAAACGFAIRWDMVIPEEMLEASIASFGGSNFAFWDQLAIRKTYCVLDTIKLRSSCSGIWQNPPGRASCRGQSD